MALFLIDLLNLLFFYSEKTSARPTFARIQFFEVSGDFLNFPEISQIECPPLMEFSLASSLGARAMT